MNRRQAGVPCVLFAGFLLIAGWWPFAPFPGNHVSWPAGRRGLVFGPPGIVFDAEPLSARVARPSGNPAHGFAVELSLEPATEPRNGVAHILTINDGRTPSSLVIGQWQSELLVRVPASGYPNRFREEGIAGLRRGQSHVVVISSDSSATAFYVDGRLARRIPGFVLAPDSMGGQLILGNAATGKSSWAGTLFGVAIFNRALDDSEVVAHQAAWTRDDAGHLRREPGLMALYVFGEGTGQEARDESPGQHHLLIPSRYTVLQKTVLEAPASALPRDWSATQDVVLNLLGFVPFGFLAFRFHRDGRPARWLPASFAAILAGAALSLVIEVGQVWLPTRDSSVRDLVSNIAGTGIGVLVACWIFGRSAGRVRGNCEA